MDKSFNDQELSDIMKEIEALEEDFQNGDAKVEASSEIIEELAVMDEKQAIPQTNKTEPSVVHMKPVTPHRTASAMSFKVSGDLNLDLQFDIGGKVVSLSVTQTGLTIEMEGGMTFTVPVTASHVTKKAS